MKLLKFDTISGKLMIRFVVIVLITILILGGLFAYLFQNYYYTNKERDFVDQGKKIADLVQNSLYKGNYEATMSFLHNSRRFFSGEVWIVNSQGLVLATTQEKKFQGVRLNKAELKQVFNGEIITKRGFSRYFDEPMLFTAVPIVIEKQVIGAVVVYSPLAGLASNLNELKQMLIWAALGAVILALLISYTLAQRFSEPLKEMKQKAVDMAHGNFSQRVEIDSDDEIGQLASSFNYLGNKLEATIDSLQEKEQLQQQFVADVSHELRTPLTSIQGFIKALHDGVYESETDRREYYAIILKEVKRLIRLVNDLLDLSRIELGQIKMELKSVDLATIIDNTVKNLEPSWQEKELTVTVDLPDELPTVKADKDRIEQVLINLISNAIDFTPQGEQIEIWGQVTAEKVEIYVADTGPGIPPDELEDIWNRFHKVDKARTSDQGGMGLGLSIVQEIIRQHEGQVWVDSEEGIGSVFGFSLPRKED